MNFNGLSLAASAFLAFPLLLLLLLGLKRWREIKRWFVKLLFQWGKGNKWAATPVNSIDIFHLDLWHINRLTSHQKQHFQRPSHFSACLRHVKVGLCCTGALHFSCIHRWHRLIWAHLRNSHGRSHQCSHWGLVLRSSNNRSWSPTRLGNSNNGSWSGTSRWSHHWRRCRCHCRGCNHGYWWGQHLRARCHLRRRHGLCRLQRWQGGHGSHFADFAFGAHSRRTHWNWSNLWSCKHSTTRHLIRHAGGHGIGVGDRSLGRSVLRCPGNQAVRPRHGGSGSNRSHHRGWPGGSRSTSDRLGQHFQQKYYILLWRFDAWGTWAKMTAGPSRRVRICIYIYNGGSFRLQVLNGRTHAGETVGPKLQALHTDMTISPHCWSNSNKYRKHSRNSVCALFEWQQRLQYSSDRADWVKSFCRALLSYKGKKIVRVPCCALIAGVGSTPTKRHFSLQG